jgi:hypothetical protein
MSNFETNVYVNTSVTNLTAATTLSFTAPSGSVFRLQSASEQSLSVTHASEGLLQSIPEPGTDLELILDTTSGKATIQASEAVSNDIGFDITSGEGGGTTQITVNADGTFVVTQVGTGVTFVAVHYFITAMPTNGIVSLVLPRFLIPVSEGNSDFSFNLLYATNLESPVATPKESDRLTISNSTNSGVTVTATSDLTPGAVTSLTVSFSTPDREAGSATFIVQRLNDTTSPSENGAPTDLTVYDDSIVITNLADNVLLQGIGSSYETIAEGDYILEFIAVEGEFNSPPASFLPSPSSTPSSTPPSWIQVTPGSGSFQLEVENNGSRLHTGLVVNTSAVSSHDPTIVNNPDKDGNPNG